MKPHYTTAPPKIRAGIESARLHGQWEAMRVCYASGHNWTPEDVLTPLSNREAELLAAGDRVCLAEFRAVSSVVLADERKCLAKAAAMQIVWSKAPSALEAATTAAADRAQATKEQIILARTQQILASEAQKREFAARARAIKFIEEES